MLAALLALVACGRTTEDEYDYEADDIIEDAQNDVGDEPPSEPVVDLPEEPSETVIFSLAEDAHIQSFAVGTVGGGYEFFEATPYLMNAGNPTFTVVEHPSGTGNALSLTGRAQVFYALDIYFAGLDLTFGARYVIAATGTTEPGTMVQLGRTDAPWSGIVVVPAGDDGEWHIEHELLDSELLEHFTGTQRGVRIMTVNPPTVDFTIYDITVTRIGERGGDPIFPEWDLNLPSLAETFAGHFLIGNIWSNHNTMYAFNTQEGFVHHFNAATAENHHKPNTIAPGGFNIPEESAFNFATADHVVNWAVENDLTLIGHTLVWHSQSPMWLKESAQGVPRTRAEARDNMEFFIRTLSEHYDSMGMLGAFYAWDVLNEAIESGGGRWGASYDDWDGGDWRTQLRNSPWLRAYANDYDADAGEHPSDYVYDAFIFARRYFPYSILYYNDYNEEIPAKRNAIAQMVEQLNERWARDFENNPEAVPAGQEYNGRLLIEAIGMQSHYHLDQWRTNLDNVRPAIERFAATGAIISITELDITVGGQGGNHPDTLPVPMSEADQQRQAEAFARIFGYYVELADYIERVSLWGKADNHSWRAWGQPLIFDSALNPKPAFHAIMDVANAAAAPTVRPPSINETTLPNGQVGNSYRGAHLSATRNNHAPILWRVTDGELPPGLILFSTTGVIGGIPTQSGTFTFTVSVENIAGASTMEFSITIS